MKNIILFLFYIISTSVGFSQSTITRTFTAGTTFEIPCGVTSVKVECWGAGGAGGGNSNNAITGGGGGGAGGNYATSTLSVTPGTTYTITVGGTTISGYGDGPAGGLSRFTGAAGTVTATGGAGGTANSSTGGAGGVSSTTGCVGTTIIAGQSGSAGTATSGGKGGNVANSLSLTAGVGGASRTTEGIGRDGSAPGGGGGGSYTPDNSDYDGGWGGRGEVVLTFSNPVPALVSASASDINPWDAQVNYLSTGTCVTGVFVEVCTDAAFSSGCSTYSRTQSSRTIREESLQCGTTYYYRVRNYYIVGGFQYDGPAITGSFTTPACPPAVANACSGATVLVDGGASKCFTTGGSTIEAGEGVCSTLSSGCFWESVWFQFAATSTESTITLNRSNNSYFDTDIVAFGPYSSSAAATAGCMPTSSKIVTNGGACVADFDDYDPLYSISFPTEIGSYYLIQVLNEDCGLFSDEDYKGCIQVDPTPTNNKPAGASLIDECGTTFNGTNKGYSPSRVLPSNENLDNNATTTCSGCASGEEVSYVVNNDSWFNFCATSTGDWSIDFEGISNCINGSGLQMTVFRGTPSNLTTIWNASSPSYEGSIQTSSAFTVTSGQCIYLVVDGFSGDQCDYQYQLNNLTTPCTLLPVDLEDFFGINVNGVNKLIWTTVSERNSDYFLVDYSINGYTWENIGKVSAAGESTGYLTYNFFDKKYQNNQSYYRLSQFDLNGKKNFENIISIDNYVENDEIIKYVNILGQEVDSFTNGVIFEIYKSGRINKTIK